MVLIFLPLRLFPPAAMKPPILIGRLADQLVENVAGEPVILDGKREGVTISAGLAMFDNTEPDLSDLLSRAERKLNKSKREGKNKVSF